MKQRFVYSRLHLVTDLHVTGCKTRSKVEMTTSSKLHDQSPEHLFHKNFTIGPR